VDIALDDDDLPDVPYLLTGLDLVVQRIECRMNRFFGEWFLDRTVGLPLVEWVTTKAPDREAVLSRIEQEIREIPGVVRTENALAKLENRLLSIQMDVITQAGTVTLSSLLDPDDPAGGAAPWALYYTSGPI
jgi:hypothetical protein